MPAPEVEESKLIHEPKLSSETMRPEWPSRLYCMLRVTSAGGFYTDPRTLQNGNVNGTACNFAGLARYYAKQHRQEAYTRKGRKGRRAAVLLCNEGGHNPQL